jgi:hypothetical protein
MKHEIARNLTFDFNVQKSKMNVANYAIDLPDNQYGVNITVSPLQGEHGEVRLGQNIVGDCAKIPYDVLAKYKRANFNILLNVSVIDWSDKEPYLFFTTEIQKVLQMPKRVEVGSIVSADTAFKSGLEMEAQNKGFEYSPTLLAGRTLENKYKLFERIKKLLYSKF